MRLVTSLVAALVVTTQIAAPVAEACGGYIDRGPAMFLVASHHGRTFVLLGGAVPETAKLDWKGNHNSYDGTEIASAPALVSAFEFTLAGEKRSRTLASKNQVFITPVFESKRAMTALEIFPKREEGMRIAVAGKHVTEWIDAEYVEVSRDVIAWAKKPGFSPPLDARLLSVNAIPGTGIELITASSVGGDAPVTYIRANGGTPYGGYGGAPLGMVTVDGERFLVFVDDGRVTPVRV